MIFTSQEAADRYYDKVVMHGPMFTLMERLCKWETSAVMCDGDVRKPIRMRQYAREALDALDRLDAECDKRYCKEETDLALDINCAYADVHDILDRLEADE